MKKTTPYKDGYLLSYAEYGDRGGFPVLIQHGMIASIDDERLFTRLIETGARVISIARPGYGDSSPYLMRNVGEWGEIVSVVVDELGLAQFDVLAISSGAPYAYAISYRFPERARNLFILSGTPALYDAEVRAHWPYPLNDDASIAELQRLAHELFFSGLSEEDLGKADIRDSMRNDCYGIALDLKIRAMDWGFSLADVKQQVYIRHSKADGSVPFITADLMSRLLADCRLDVRENDVHFSQEVLDDFISSEIAGFHARNANSGDEKSTGAC